MSTINFNEAKEKLFQQDFERAKAEQYLTGTPIEVTMQKWEKIARLTPKKAQEAANKLVQILNMTLHPEILKSLVVLKMGTIFLLEEVEGIR